MEEAAHLRCARRRSGGVSPVVPVLLDRSPEFVNVRATDARGLPNLIEVLELMGQGWHTNACGDKLWRVRVVSPWQVVTRQRQLTTGGRIRTPFSLPETVRRSPSKHNPKEP